MRKCRLRIARRDFDVLMKHLFSGDRDEHGAVVLAAIRDSAAYLELYVREVHLAKDGIDYVKGKIGHRALNPTFIHRMITRARDERLVYLAVHNHESDLHVDFSEIDLASHERGYPALLQIARGMPVGALVFGRRSVQADLWAPDGTRSKLDCAVVVGSTLQHLRSSPTERATTTNSFYDRQVRMFGRDGQRKLAESYVGIVGLGGIGSLVAEYLARLGVGHFLLVDNDKVEESNLSRIVGATRFDSLNGTAKVDVAKRVILQCNEKAIVHSLAEDVAKESVALQLVSCDYLFLAADSMRARLVCNALVHQYLIPGVQLGSKVRVDAAGIVIDVVSANRPLRPTFGCLWCNQLIDPALLAKEAKTDEERKSQAYGTEEANPSVITLNAISAAHAANDFLLDYLAIRAERPLYYEHFHLLAGKQSLVLPRQDPSCPECSPTGLRYARADGVSLPCIEG